MHTDAPCGRGHDQVGRCRAAQHLPVLRDLQAPCVDPEAEGLLVAPNVHPNVQDAVQCGESYRPVS